MAVVRNVVVRVGADVSQLQRELQKAEKTLSKVGGNMKNVGSSLTGSITAPLAGIGVLAVKTAADFEKSMSNVRAVTGASGEDFDKMRNLALDMGKSTSKSATEAAEAIGYMGLAGWDTTKIMTGLEPVLRLSEAGNLDLARTSDLVTDSMSALGLEVKELPKFLDQVAQTSRKSNTSVEMLMDAFLSVGGMFNQLNVPMDEANALLGVLANRGIKGSEAGNKLSSTLLNMTTGAGQAGVAMKELGISAFDNNGKFKGVTVVLQELREKTKNMTDEQKNMYLAMIGGKTQVDTLNALLDGTGKELLELTGQIADSNGALNDMASTMQDNLYGQLTVLQSSLEGLAIQLGDKLLPFVKIATSFIQALAEKISSLPDSVIVALIGLGAFSAILPIIIFAIGTLITAIGTIVGVLAGLSSTVLIVVASISGVVLVFGAWIGAMIAAYNSSDTFKTSVDGLISAVVARFSQFKTVVLDVFNAIKAVFEENKHRFAEIFEAIMSIWSSFVNFLTSLIEGDISGALNSLEEYVRNAFNLIDVIIVNVMEALIEYMPKAWSLIKEAIIRTVDVLKNELPEKWETIKNAISDKIDSLKERATKKWDDIKNAIIEKMDKLREDLPQKMQDLSDKIIKKIGEWEKDFPEKVKQVVKLIVDAFFGKDNDKSLSDNTDTALENVKTSITANTPTITNAIKELVKAMVKGLAQLAIDVAPHIPRMISTMVKGLISGGATLVGTVNRNIVIAISTALIGLGSKAYSWGSKLITQFQSGINSKVAAIKKTISSMANAVSNYFPKSPAKEGAFKKAPQWGYKLMEQFDDGLYNSIPKLASTTDNLTSKTFDNATNTNTGGLGTNGTNIYVTGNNITTDNLDSLIDEMASRMRFRGVF